MVGPVVDRVKNKRVFVGLSGGVDSAVSAAILKENGAEVFGVFMKNWAGEAGLQLDCPWEEDQRSAEAVARHLDIPFRSYNFEQEYKQNVLDYFFYEYSAGRTPNPDILCNSEIKFKAFLDKAVSEGGDMIATGHYAGKSHRAVRIGDTELEAVFLHRSTDPHKDQTYFLSALTEGQLEKAVFPLSGLTKPEVRELAIRYDLPNAKRKDSQGICFIGDLDVQEFLRKYLARDAGDIVDVDTGKKVGDHDGLSFYTIGQREGLRIGGSPQPYYVAAKDVSENKLLVAQGKSHPALYTRVVGYSDLVWINHALKGYGLDDINGLGLTAAVRYRQEPESGRFETGRFVFENNQWAVAPGQSLVIYHGDICLGRAVIENY